MSSRFITYPVAVDSRDLMQRAFDYMAKSVPGWTPAEGNLDVWLIEAFGDQAADIATMTSMVPKTIFRYFGTNIMGIRPLDAVSAFCTSTWYFTDDVGYLIPAGTQVGIRDSVGNLMPFAVLADVSVAGGNSNTDAGQVILVAMYPGAGSSNLGSIGGPVELIDTLAFVDHITQTDPTTGGQDAETDDQYLNRLTVEMQAISPRPILAKDFSIVARNVAGVQRAVTLDGYNPGDNSWNNEKMVTVVAVDADGLPVSSTIKTSISTYLEGMREINFVVHVMDAVQHEIDITVHAVKTSSYSQNDVASRIISAVMDYLNPSTWGITPDDDPNNPLSWNNQTTIRYLDLAGKISQLSGVDHVTLLTIGAHGGSQSAVDYTIPGVVPLPFTHISDISVVVS